MYHSPITQPTLLVLKEKHDNRYFVVNNDEEFAKAAVKVLRQRRDEGYWYPTVEEVQSEYDVSVNRLKERIGDTYLNLTEDEVNSLPQVLKEQAQKAFSDFKNRISRLEASRDENLEFIKNVNRVVDTPDGHTLTFQPGRLVLNLAVHLLDYRSDYEYEEYTLQRVESLT